LKKWRLASQIIGLLLMVTVIVLAGWIAFLYIRGPHWTLQEIDDRTARPLPITISSVKEGLPVATALAQKWRQDAVLSGITVYLKGAEAIKGRKGEIAYDYYAVNNDSWGHPEGICEVTVDMMKQAITRIQVRGDPRGGNVPMSLDWSLEIADIFEIIESSKTFTYSDNPMVIIHPGTRRCSVTVGSAPDAWGAERVEFIINNSTKQIESVRQFPKSTMPR